MCVCVHVSHMSKRTNRSVKVELGLGKEFERAIGKNQWDNNNINAQKGQRKQLFRSQYASVLLHY